MAVVAANILVVQKCAAARVMSTTSANAVCDFAATDVRVWNLS